MQYALAIAAGSESSPELGAIHLLKYLYLVDLAYAQKHGETFTGAIWRFHTFGPWSEEVWKSIEPSLMGIRASRRTFSSPRFEGEGVRWRLSEQIDEVTTKLEMTIPWEMARVIRLHVKQFGDDTTELLHYVYATKPMLSAAPGQLLVFEPADDPRALGARQSEKRQTERQGKRLRQTRDRVREELMNRMSLRKAKLVAPDPPPRYDDTFEEGLSALDADAGPKISSERGELTFSDEIWKSRGRHDSGTS